MNPLLIGAIAGGGLGLLQDILEKEKLKKAQKQQAIVARLSPWTGLRAQEPEDKTNILGSIAGGAVSGAQQGGAFQKLSEGKKAVDYLKGLQAAQESGVVTPVGPESVDPGIQMEAARVENLSPEDELAFRRWQLAGRRGRL